MNIRRISVMITLSPVGKKSPHVTVEAILDTGCEPELVLPGDVVKMLKIHLTDSVQSIVSTGSNEILAHQCLVDVTVEGQTQRRVEALCLSTEFERVLIGLPLILKLSQSRPIQNALRQAFQLVDSSRITLRRLILDDFDKLIEKKGIRETKISQFLQENFWIFGPEYVAVSAEDKLGLKSRTDFLVRKHDGFHDIIEMKLPGIKLFTKKNEREVWASTVGNAVNQMMDYLTKYSFLYLSQKEQTGLDVFMPTGIIIVGRSTERNDYLLRVSNSYLHRIEIVTYDTLVRRARANLDDLGGSLKA